MARFEIKDNPDIPYTYHLNSVAFNKERNIKSQRWKRTYAEKYQGKMIAHLPYKSLSKL